MSDTSRGSAPAHRPVPWLVWLVIGLLVFATALLSPATGDDWRRINFADRTPAGFLAESHSYYQNHNGRAVANTVSYLLMEPLWLRALVKSAAVVGLVAALYRVTGGRTVWSILVCFVGVFLVPPPVFRQSLGWSTGFFHYVPPMIGVVLLVGTLAGRWPGGRRADTWSGAAVCATLGALTCLFIEHVTVAAALLAVGGLGLTLATRGTPSKALVGWAVGVLLGTAVMLLSPGFRSTASGQDPYYSRTGDWLDTAVFNYSRVAQSFVLSSPVILALVLLSCMAVGVTGLRRERAAPYLFVVLSTVLVGVYAIVSRTWLADRLVCAEPSVPGCDVRALGVDVLMLALLLAVLVVTALRGVRPGQDRVVWVGMLAATLLMLGPLLLVQPIGPRNIYGPLVTVVGLVAVTARPLTGGRSVGARASQAALLTMAVVGLGWLGAVQWANAQVSAARVSAMEEAVAERRSEVVLPPFPHPQWVHVPDDDKMGHHYYLERRQDIGIRFSG